MQSVLLEDRVFPPSASSVSAARVAGMAGYDALCLQAEQDFEGFWANLAREHLAWITPFSRTLDESRRRLFLRRTMEPSPKPPIRNFCRGFASLPMRSKRTVSAKVIGYWFICR
jgi:hypothetical protein